MPPQKWLSGWDNRPVPKKWSRVRGPKFLFESTSYLLVAMAIKSMTQILARVPPCLSFILFLPLLQGPRPSLFVSQQADSHSPTPTIPLSSSLLCCCRVSTLLPSLPPSLTLSAKWHFTGCFLLLIPTHFASWDSIKAFIKHTPLYKASAKDRNKFQLLLPRKQTQTHWPYHLHVQIHASTNARAHPHTHRQHRIGSGMEQTCCQSAAHEDFLAFF